MRRLQNAPLWIICVLLAGSLVLVLPQAQAAPMHRHAVLIGISDYAHYNQSGLFPNLHCKEDIRRIKAALVHTFKFDPDPKHGEIVELTEPEQSTRAKIEAALDTLARDAADGDLIYIHYSGHGAQVPDKAKSTGLGDAIIPSDYKDDGSNWITGRWLGDYIKKLKATHPNSRLVLSFDCCHSGTATRGSSIRRGITYQEYIDWAKKHHVKPATPQSNPADRAGVTRSAQGVLSDLNGAGYVVLSACTNEQVEGETDDGNVGLGKFSFCLARVLSDATPSTTYQEVIDEVRAMFRARGWFEDRLPDTIPPPDAVLPDVQAPQIDGDAKTLVLGGTAAPPPASILVYPAPSGHYQLDAGKLHGMTVGSVFAIYAKNKEVQPKNQIAEAKIKSVDLTTSELELTRRIKPGLQPADLTGAHAVEQQHNYSQSPLKLDTDSVRHVVPMNADAILAKLSDPKAPLRMIRTKLVSGEKPDIAMARVPASAFASPARGEQPAPDKTTAKPPVLALVRSDTGIPILPIDETQDVSDQVYSGLQKVARYQYAAGLGQDQRLRNRVELLRIRLVPCDPPTKDADGNLVFTRDRTVAPDAPLHVGDHFTIEVQNAGQHPLHLAVLDLESNADVSVQWPAEGTPTEDNVIQPTPAGKWVKLWEGSDTTRIAVYHCTSADPHEIYKAIATRDYVNFNILRTRGQSRGPNNPFSDLFGPGVDEGLRGTGDETRVPAASWTASDCIFKVVP